MFLMNGTKERIGWVGLKERNWQHVAEFPTGFKLF